MEQKEEKPVKIPGALKKPISENKFTKRFYKYIEHSGDRDFFNSCFNKSEDIYTIRENLSKHDTKRLDELLKSIKKNRKGAIKFVPLAFAAIVVAGIIVFFTIFANPLLERALEKGLEAIFEAKSDVDNFRLSLFRFQISIRGITVANRDSPMKNLFQMGKTEIRLRPAAVLRGKIYIEEIRADTIRFGTERTVSGTLPQIPPKPKKQKPPSNEPPLVDLKNFDAKALLEREYNKLKTPGLYDEAINAYNEVVAKWKGRVEGTKARAEELKTAAQPLLSLNTANFRDVQEIPRIINDINTMVTSVQGAADDVTQIVKSIEGDVNTAIGLEKSAVSALTDDINHLKSYINLSSGSAMAALEPSIREVLSGTAEEYLDYGLRGLEALEKLKAESDAKPKTEKPPEEKKAAFKGRDVIFPQNMYPKFFLGILASDFTLDAWNWAFDLRDISSNPDMTGKPVSLTLGLNEDGKLKRSVGVNSKADFRTNPTERFSVVVNGAGFPVSLGDQLKKAGINGFEGTTNFSVNMSGRTDGGASGGGEVHINQARILNPQGTIAEAVDAAVRDVSNIDLGIQYTHWVGRDDEFKVTTNIADLIARALRNAVDAYAKKAMDEAERLLREKINQYIDGRFVSKEEVDLLLRMARGDKAAIDETKNLLTKKRTEFEQKAKAAVEQVKEEAKEEAQKQANQALQDALEGKQPSLQTPSIQLPSLPSTGGLKLPGR